MENINILFVDDDLQIQDVYLKILRKYTIHQAISGQQAIDIYLEKKDIIDLIILDMTLGVGITGYDVFKKLFEINPNIKIVICTGQVSKTTQVHELLNNYKCKFLLKPIDNKELFSIIDNLSLF